MGNICSCSCYSDPIANVEIVVPPNDESTTASSPRPEVLPSTARRKSKRSPGTAQSPIDLLPSPPETDPSAEIPKSPDFNAMLISGMEAHVPIQLEQLTTDETSVLAMIAPQTISVISWYQRNLLGELFDLLCLGRDTLGLDDIPVIIDYLLRATAVSNHPETLASVILQYFKSSSNPSWFDDTGTDPPFDLELTRDDFIRMVQDHNIDQEMMTFLAETSLCEDNPSPLADAIHEAFESIYTTLNSRLGVSLLHSSDRAQMHMMVADTATLSERLSREEFDCIATKLMILLRTAIAQAWIITHQKDIRHPLLVVAD